MAAENLTPKSYIEHHLKFLNEPVGDGGNVMGFLGMSLNLDTLITSAILGSLVFGFCWWITRSATAGVPGKRQAFVELCVEFVNGQVKSIFDKSYSFVAPLALTVFIWVLFMNAMDFLPIDWIAKGLNLMGVHEFRPVPTADINATFALALSVWILMIAFAIKAKGLGGFVHELYAAPFGAPKLTRNPLSWVGAPLLALANFSMQMIEYISKPLSHSLRLFGNMYAGEIIFLLLWVWAAHVTFAGGLLSDLGAAVSFASTVALGLGWSIFHILIVGLQAFIFMMLTVVYIALAHEHH